MQITDIGLGVLEIIPDKFGDDRGFFAETFNLSRLKEAGVEYNWVQDNQSHSSPQYVLRGLHLQTQPFEQAKLVRVLKGTIFDVAVDVRLASPTFGRWVARELSSQRFNQILVPTGFAHGFLTLEPETDVVYKVSAPYSAQHDRAIRWSDPIIGVNWPLPSGVIPILSKKDAAAPLLESAIAPEAGDQT